MGHLHNCCNKQKVKRGLWSPEEDEKLINYISNYGHGCWSSLPKLAGLQRCGKSCRLRWINYLRPDLKRGSFSPQEAALIIELHRILGNRWAQIAKHLPGRTDNEVKNFWNSSIKKKLISHGRLSGPTLSNISNPNFQTFYSLVPNNPADFIQNNNVVVSNVPSSIMVQQQQQQPDHHQMMNNNLMFPVMPSVPMLETTTLNDPTWFLGYPQQPQNLVDHQNYPMYNNNNNNFGNEIMIPQMGYHDDLPGNNLLMSSSSSSSSSGIITNAQQDDYIVPSLICSSSYAHDFPAAYEMESHTIMPLSSSSLLPPPPPPIMSLLSSVTSSSSFSALSCTQLVMNP